MVTTLLAHFDGQHFVPDEPVDLPIGTPLRVQVEAISDQTISPIDEIPTPKVTPAPRKWQPLDIQIDPELANAIALDPEFNIEES